MTSLASTTADYAALVALLRAMPECAHRAQELAAAAMQHRPEDARRFALFGAAVGQVETIWGKARDYIDCAGDWTLRTGHWLHEPRVRVVDGVPAGSPWRLPHDKQRAVIPGPYAMPNDGRGWGRYEMQLDWANAQGLTPNDHAGAIMRAMGILAAGVAAFPGRPDAAAASYNAGPARVQAAMNSGRSPDSVTTSGDYAARVLGWYRRWSLLVLP